MTWPNIEAIGLKVTVAYRGRPPYVAYDEIRKGLGQWRYSLAWRIDTREFPHYGIPCDDLEPVLKRMARECRKCWPKKWTIAALAASEKGGA